MKEFLFSLWKIPGETWAWLMTKFELIQLDSEFYEEAIKVGIFEVIKIICREVLTIIRDKIKNRKSNVSDTEVSK